MDKRAPVRYISYKLIGNKTSRGHEYEMPEPHRYKEIVQLSLFNDFLERCKDFPDQRHSCDLSPAGFSIQFEYEWRLPMPIESYSGSGPMGDDPGSIEDHPLYKTVEKKNEQMKKSGVSKPFIPIIGEHAIGPLHDVFGRFPSARDVLHSAYRQCSYVSGTVIVSLDSSLDGIGEGKSNLVPICSCSLNPNCKAPIEASDWDRIRALTFDRWNYSYAYLPESYTKNMKSHRDHEGGSATFSTMQPDRPWSLTLPEHQFRQLLCAEKTFAELGYGDELERYGQEILDGDRSITNLEFIVGNSRQQIPDQVKVTFGPRRDRVY